MLFSRVTRIQRLGSPGRICSPSSRSGRSAIGGLHVQESQEFPLVDDLQVVTLFGERHRLAQF